MVNPWLILGAVLAVLGSFVIGYIAGVHSAQRKADEQRLLAFGATLAQLAYTRREHAGELLLVHESYKAQA